MYKAFQVTRIYPFTHQSFASPFLLTGNIKEIVFACEAIQDLRTIENQALKMQIPKSCFSFFFEALLKRDLLSEILITELMSEGRKEELQEYDNHWDFNPGIV